jgi:hypothetical protein
LEPEQMDAFIAKNRLVYKRKIPKNIKPEEPSDH